MKAVASYIKLQIDAAYVKLQALTTYQHLAIEVQYVLLKVTAITGKFVEYIYVDDTITETDATTLAITKQLTDIAELAEQISLGTGKSFADSQAMSDLIALVVNFNRAFADTASFSDATTRSVSKVLADSVTETDAATRAVTKLIADSLAMVDSVVSINFTDAENDALAIDDLGIGDDPAWNLGKNLSDTASTTDAGLLIMQDYCDITYFLEDYVGLSRTF
tara:strand:- start:105 stop:767 length:663 start_codon:yes stop_codon:yes gene_type:complete